MSSSDDYARRFAGATGAWMLSVQTRAIDTLIAGIDGTVLDVGGGHAQVTPHLMDQGRTVTALVSDRPVAARLDRLTGGRAPWIVGDIDELTLPDRSYDIVVAMRMMAHVADWERFLASLCRVARKAVIVDFPLAGGIHRLVPLLFGMKKAIEQDTRRYTRIDQRAVAAACAANGFAADGQVGQFVVPMAFHRAVRSVPVSRGAEALFSPLAPRLGNPMILRAQRGTP